MEESMDNLVDLPGWDAAGKERLAAQIVARDLGVDAVVIQAGISLASL